MIEKAAALPKIQKHQLALLGHARGAGACLDFVCTHPGKVQALVLNSCGYPPGITKRAAEVNALVLMLHGTVDSPSDGTPFHDIELARRFEEALKKANKEVEVKCYEASDINGLFTNPLQFDDTVERASSFLRKKFKK